MIAYVARRLGLAVLTVLAISGLSFAIIQLAPGDFLDSYIASQGNTGTAMSDAAASALRQQYGLAEPEYVQYLKWMSLVVTGNFGQSLVYNRPVLDVIGDRLGLTVVVSLAALIFTWGLAMPIGIYSAVKQYSPGDYLATFLGFVGLAIPNFLLALVVLYIAFANFNVNIGGLFSQAYAGADVPWSAAKVLDLAGHLPLPAFILALAGSAQLIRVMRANLLDELRKPYVVTARAKGLSESRLILKYPVRVAMNPFASTVGYLLPHIVSGSIIVSLVLNLPTVGPLLLQALRQKDMFLAGAIILLLGALTVIGTLLSDLLLMWIDPRIRQEG